MAFVAFCLICEMFSVGNWIKCSMTRVIVVDRAHSFLIKFYVYVCHWLKKKNNVVQLIFNHFICDFYVVALCAIYAIFVAASMFFSHTQYIPIQFLFSLSLYTLYRYLGLAKIKIDRLKNRICWKNIDTEVQNMRIWVFFNRKNTTNQ